MSLLTQMQQIIQNIGKDKDKLEYWHDCVSCDALHDLVPFVQFKKRKNTHWGVLLLKVTLLHGCFSRFLKMHKWCQIA